MIKVTFGNGIKATVDEGVWSVGQPEFKFFETALNDLTQQDLRFRVYGGVSQPDVDLESSIALVARFGGKITDKSEHEGFPPHDDSKEGILE